MRRTAFGGMMPHVKPYRLAPEQAHAVWNSSGLMTFKATGADTDGHFWLMEYLVGPGTILSLHSHASEDQAWYVLDGELHCTVGELVFRAPPATFVYVPRGVLHQLTVETSSASSWCWEHPPVLSTSTGRPVSQPEP
jgi:quercetin dioxygenase-like cupin family protein